MDDLVSHSPPLRPARRRSRKGQGLDAGTIGASSIFSGEEETFAWARAVSRLTEMGTKSWAEGNKVDEEGHGSEARREMMMDQAIM